MSETTTPPPAQPRRGLFAFFFKSALGCAVFALGLLLGLVLALPMLASGWARGAAEDFFREHHQGRLAVGAVSLAWFSEQRVTDAVLLDPEGKEVARASVTLPSLSALLRSGGTKLGTVWIQASADLVADDAGVTNLARALAPRNAPTHTGGEQDADGGSTSSSSGLDTLAKLELELELTVQRLRWSDVETRRLGRPFELTGLVLRASAKPGAPITVKADAQVAGDAPGSFAIDAKINGPITPGADWPFGKVEARGKLTGFSAALVDGLAGQSGRLKELLGPAFDLEFTANDVTNERGELALELRAPATTLTLAARVEDGVLRANGARFLDARIALPRAYLGAFVLPNLPAGSTLDFGAAPEPWSARIDAFEARIPSFAALDVAHLAPVLEAATLRATVSLPSAVGFSNAETQRAFGRACALEGTSLEVALAPKTAPRVALRTTLVANARSPVTFTAASKDAWAALAKGEVPHVDGDFELDGVPVAALDAFLGTEGRLARGLGASLKLAVKLEDAGLDRGRLDARVVAPQLTLEAPLQLAGGRIGCADGQTVRMTLDAPAGWIEGWIAGVLPPGYELASDDGHVALTVTKLILPLPPTAASAASGAAPSTASAQTAAAGASDPIAFLRGATRATLKLELPSVRLATPETRAAKVPLRVFGGMLDVKLETSGAAQVIVGLGLDTGPTGNVTLHADVDDVWALLPKDGKLAPRPVTATLDVSNVASALLGAYAGAETAELVGGPMALHVETEALDLVTGRFSAQFQAGHVGANLAGRLEERVLRCTGADAINVSANLAPGEFERRVAPFLPAGAALTWSRASDAFLVEVRELELPLPDFLGGAPFALEPLLDGVRGKIGARLPALAWADEHTRAANVGVSLERAVATVELGADRSAKVVFDAAVVADGRGTLHVETTLLDPWFALRTPAKPLPPLDARVKLAGLSTRALDGFAGADGLVSKLLGPALDVDATLAGVTPDAGSVQLAAHSASMQLAFAGALQDGALVTRGDAGLELALKLPAGWLEEQLSPKLPAGARLSVPTDVQPLALRVNHLRVVLPKGDPVAASPSAPGTNASAPTPSGGERKSAPGDRLKGVKPADVAQGTPKGAAGANAAGANASEGAGLASALALVGGLALDLELTVPELVYADAKTDAAGRPVTIRGLKAEAKLAPDALPFVHVAATLGDGSVADPNASPAADASPTADASLGAGVLAADVRALDPLKVLAEEHGLDRFRVACDVSARGVPTALVDALAGQGGLLVEALGGRVEMSVKSESLSMQAGALVADMASDLHHVHVEGAMQDGAFVITKQNGLDARVGLGPVMNEKVVGRLVPMLVNLKKPEGSAPSILAVDAMSFPLDGNLRALDATVRIDLGEVTYALLPGLEQVFGNAVELKPTKLPAMTVPITKGVASYKDLKLKLAGTECAFSGSFDLVDLSMKLDTGVPLKLLGKKVSKELEKVREYVSPDLVVPIEIRGAWNKPKIGIGDGFVEKLVEDAAKKGLGGLLEGLFDKKKKKD
ncbi:MAG: hypothetical protein U1F29_06640 [Planctomycetota bacterium]